MPVDLAALLVAQRFAKWIIRLDLDLASFRCRHRHPPRLSIVDDRWSLSLQPFWRLGYFEEEEAYLSNPLPNPAQKLMNVTINPSTIGGDSPQKSINSPTVPWWWSGEGAAAALAAAVALSHHHVDWHRRRHRRLGLHTTTTSTRCKQTAVPIPHNIGHNHHDDDNRW